MRFFKKTLAVTFAASWLFAAPATAQGPQAAPPGQTQPALQPAPTQPAPTQPGVVAPPPAGGVAGGMVAPGQTPPPMGGQQVAPAPGQMGAPLQGAPPGAPQVPPGAQPGQPPAPVMDGQTYSVRLRDLESRIDELKEQIRRSHTRLSLLSDTILSGGGAGSRANIKYTNELSGAFKITRLLVVLDGAVQYSKTDQTGAIADAGEIPIFNGSIPPGDHTVQVLVNLQGSGYGVWSYLRGYKFEVRSNHSFTALEGKTTTLGIVSFEKGGVTTKLEERPAVRYVEKVTQGLADPNAAGAPGQPGVTK